MVRCPACASLESEWAPRCGSCGADLAGAALVGPRSHRARSHRGLVVVAAAVLAPLVLLLAVALRSRPHSGAPIVIVAVEPSGRLVAHDLRSGAVRVLANDAAGWPEGPVVVRGHVLYVSGGQLVAVDGRRPIAAADQAVGVAATDEVWVAPTTVGAPGNATLLRASLDWQAVASLRLDPDETLAGAADGYLVTVAGGTVQVRSAPSWRVLWAAGPVQDASDVVGVTSTAVVFVRRLGCAPGCPVARLGLRDGRVDWIGPLADMPGYMGGGAVNGSRLAAFTPVGDPAAPTANVVFIDEHGTQHFVLSAVHALDPTHPVGAAAWDPSGRWLVFGGSAETYALDTRSMLVTRLPFVAGYGFSVVDLVDH